MAVVLCCIKLHIYLQKLRCTDSRRDDGCVCSTATGATCFIHRLVRSERLGDKVRQRTLLNLGRHFEVIQNDWPVLCRRIKEVLRGQMRLLPDCPPVLEAHVQHLAAQLLARHADLQPTVTLYDLTNTFFEGVMHRQPRARRGHAKDQRTDCPLLTLGLVLDASGFVRRSQVFAGNMPESHTLAGMLDALNAPRGALVVMDCGSATEDRIQWLREQGYRYLVVSRDAPGTLTPPPRSALRPPRVTACSCTRSVRRCPGGAPVRLLRKARRQGTRPRRALRQTLRGRTHPARRGTRQTADP